MNKRMSCWQIGTPIFNLTLNPFTRSGRVVGGTLMRQTSQPAYNGAPYGYQTMVTTGKTMHYNGMAVAPPNSMLASQPNFSMDFGIAQGMMKGLFGTIVNFLPLPPVIDNSSSHGIIL